MRRRRPTAVYRVLDEEDLLHGTDFLDAPDQPVEEEAAAAGRWSVHPRGRVLLVCAGALVLAVIVARLASLLLAGAGALRSPRLPGGQRPALPPMVIRSPIGSAPGGGGQPRPAFAARRRPAPASHGPARPAPAERRSAHPAGSPGGGRRMVPAQTVRAAAGDDGAAVHGPPSRGGPAASTGGRTPTRASAAEPDPQTVAGPQEFGFER